VFAVAAAAFWGLNASLGRSLLDDGLSAIQLTQLRGFFVVVVVGIGLAIARRDLLFIPWRHALAYAPVGGIGVAAAQATSFYAITRLSIGAALVIQYTYPFLILLGSWVMWRRSAPAQFWVAAAVALLGSALVVRIYDIEGVDFVGVGVAALAAVTTAYYIVGSESAGRRQHPLTSLFWLFAFAFAALALVDPPWNFPGGFFTSARHIELGIGVGLIGTLLPFGCLTAALRLLPSAQVGVVLMSQVVFGALFAVFLHSEALSLVQWLGGALVLGAVAAVQRMRDVN
jgi:drug/metabolite transporter (DMT)-like permease